MFYIDNAIYNMTLLEGLPFTLKYCESRPKHVYNVNSGKPTLHNFRGWHNLKENPPMWKIQNLFIHDISHAVLYFLRNEKYRLFKNDFGLTWDNVRTINDKQYYFSNEKQRIDEYKISTIHDILLSSITKKGLLSFKEEVSTVENFARFVWHTDNKITPIVRKEKRREIESAIHYVYNEIGPAVIRDGARSFIKYMKDVS